MESDLDGIVEEGCSKQTASANYCQLPQQPSNEPTNETQQFGMFQSVNTSP